MKTSTYSQSQRLGPAANSIKPETVAHQAYPSAGPVPFRRIIPSSTPGIWDTAMIRTSTCQDARFYAAYLQHCIDNPKTHYGYTYLWLKDHASLIMGAPLVDRSEDFDEQLRTAEFHKYCEAVELYLIYINMYRVEDEFVKADFPYPVPPEEVSYVRVTRFGRFYVRLPFWLQVVMVFLIEKGVSFSLAWKRFKWLGSIVGLVIGATGWNKTHQLSGLLVIGSTVAGLFTAWVVSTFLGFLGEDGHGPLGDDPLE